MTGTFRRLWLTLVMAAVMAAYAPPLAADAQETPPAQASASVLIGSWSLESWTLANGSPRCSEEEGRVSGLLVYTSDGHMSVQLGCSEIDVGDLAGLSPQQVAARLSRRHFTYYGAYTVDAAAQTVTHHVEGSSSPGFVGSHQVRLFVFEAPDRIVLSPEGSGQRLVWLRNHKGGRRLSALDKLAEYSGKWIGISRLRVPSMDISDDSPSTAELTSLLGGKFIRLDYTWAYKGAAQEGSLLIGYESGPAIVTAHWVDTWHMGEAVLSCKGIADDDGSVVVLGSYAAPPGPDWGWRIVLQPVDGTTLRLVMYNITPDGEEELAVEADYRRTED